MARVVSSNKNAYHDYTVEDKVEAGIVLEGWEVKSVKQANVNLRGAYVYYNDRGELILRGVHIGEWRSGEKKNDVQKSRERKLLVHRQQAAKLGGMSKRPGYALVPMELIVNDGGLIKVVLGLVKGKRKFDKRRALKEREMDNELRRASKPLAQLY